MSRNPVTILFRSALSASAAWLGLVCGASAGAEETIDFNRDIRPILSQNCFACHGPDAKERKGGRRASGGLRLDTEDGALMDLGGYAALAPGDPEESELFFLITTDDEDERMPPPDHGEALNDREVALLKRWIEQGGAYDRHWSYKRAQRPDVPEIEKRGFALRNPIDHFVARRLVSENLVQAPEADRYALARRAALDLTGLPPSLDEVEDFVADKRPDAYERYVEGQLSKPGYGEHWARMWLDLARYADSAGYADDPLRTIWGFRDYVIRSFNENKPFDQFTLEQIAGDLLPNPTTEQLVATAFHRNTKTNSEGGTDDEEFRNEAVVDRVNTTMGVWMGTTMTCAQCHSHKYDPITQEEYFKVFAIFNSSQDEDRKDEAPVISVFTEEQESQRAEASAKIAALRETLVAELSSKDHRKRRLEWENRLKAKEGWTVLKPLGSEVTTSSKAPATVATDGTIQIGENSAPRGVYTLSVTPPVGMGAVTGLKLEVLPSSSDKLAWVLNEIEVNVLPASESEEGRGKGKAKVAFVNPSATFEEEAYPITGAFDGKKNDRFSGWAVDGNREVPNEAVFEFAEPVELPEGARLQIRLVHDFPKRKFHRFRLHLSDETKPMPALPQELTVAIEKKERSRRKAEKKALLEYFAAFEPEPTEGHRKLAEAQAELEAIKPLTTVPIMREVPANRWRQTHVQRRGNFMDKGQAVEPGVPAAFNALPKGAKPDRLGLARWLVHRDNPLTARVVANRYWEALFGTGLVSTSEEFGSQGELPSHPELLDWLAVELMESGWDLKHLLALITTSATYRQSSIVTADQLESDPDNRLLARGPRFRISAEMIRDQALAASGLLSGKMHGPSVNPPQPKLGLKAAFGSGTDWKTSKGEDKYRRGVYTTWRRSNPYPSMATFDAPNRDVCLLRRERTNTPLQALVTLNDPVYIEAAQALGRRMLAFEGPVEEKAGSGFQLCLLRSPSEAEVETLVKLYRTVKTRFENSPERAMELASNPLGPIPSDGDASEYAAWTVVANALLNLDEMFLKR